MESWFNYFLAIHIIFVVCWMAGLFYMVRLFIYHTEAQVKPEPDRKILSGQFEIMESETMVYHHGALYVFGVGSGAADALHPAFLLGFPLDEDQTGFRAWFGCIPFRLPK